MKKLEGGAYKDDRRFQNRRVAFHDEKISLDLTAQMEQKLKSKDISGVQAYFMVYILRHHPEGTYLTELSHEIGLSKSTLSALIKKLKEKNYICLQENPKDGRRKKVVPTAKLKKKVINSWKSQSDGIRDLQRS